MIRAGLCPPGLTTALDNQLPSYEDVNETLLQSSFISNNYRKNNRDLSVRFFRFNSRDCMVVYYYLD